MKIIIVGAGISGLSTYLHLRKHLSSGHDIVIYESHKPRPPILITSQDNTTFTLNDLSSSTALVGGGLGVSPNGMRVLRDLDISLHDAVVAQGFPVEQFIFKAAAGWTLGKQKTGDGNVREKGEIEEVCISSSRHGLWEVLMKSIGDDVVKYRKVIGIKRDEASGRVSIRTIDGTGIEQVDIADLLIGADGSKSVVRTALFGDEDQYKPKYTGLSGVGGFLKQPIPDLISKNKAMVFTFGGNGFFGYSSSGPESAESVMWWSTFATDSLPATQNIDRTAIKDSLLKRHKHWKDPILQDIIQKADIQSIYPTWVLGELPYWGQNGIVLIGDAAHALDPTTGQGVSQALEDSQALALLLAECLKRSQSEEKEAVAMAIKLLHEIRNPRVVAIAERGKKISGSKANVGVVIEYAMYFFLWLMMTFPIFGRMMIGDVNRELYGWSANAEIEKALKKHDFS